MKIEDIIVVTSDLSFVPDRNTPCLPYYVRGSGEAGYALHADLCKAWRDYADDLETGDDSWPKCFSSSVVSMFGCDASGLGPILQARGLNVLAPTSEEHVISISSSTLWLNGRAVYETPATLASLRKLGVDFSPEPEQEPLLYWYSFTFQALSNSGTKLGNIYIGLTTRSVTIPDIENAKRGCVDMPSTAVMTGMFYLGHMTKSTLQGDTEGNVL